MELKLLSYNIHKGFNWNRRRTTIQEIKETIYNLKIDIAFIQECVGEPQLKSLNQFEFLADSIWSEFNDSQNAAYSGHYHGNAILSKFPIIKDTNIDISTNRFETRKLLHCEIQIPGTKQIIHAVCLHLSLWKIGRQKQYQAILNYILKKIPPESPLIIAGDFNDWNKIASFHLEEILGVKEVFRHTQGCYAKTFPSFLPFLSLDRIYIRHFHVNEVHLDLHSEVKHLSDHLPLATTIKFL